MVVELLAAGASKAASHTLLNGSRAGKGRQVLVRFFFAALALGACSRRLGSLGRLCSEGEEIQERSVRVARVRRVQQEKPMKNGATPAALGFAKWPFGSREAGPWLKGTVVHVPKSCARCLLTARAEPNAEAEDS